jgi:molybdate transport system substrate-binding protein
VFSASWVFGSSLRDVRDDIIPPGVARRHLAKEPVIGPGGAPDRRTLHGDDGSAMLKFRFRRRCRRRTVLNHPRSRSMRATNRFLPFLAAAGLVIAAGLLTAAGCGYSFQMGGPLPSDGDPAAAAAGEVVILCGGSFREPMERLVQRYEEKTGGKAVLAFGQSEDHLPKVKMQSVGDVFVSHDPYIQYTEDAGSLARYVAVGYMVPALVVAKGNPKNVEKIEDLAAPGLKVVLPHLEHATCGQMVDALLRKRGIHDAVMANVGNAQVRSHSEVATTIATGLREVGIMWKGVAYNWLEKLDIVPTPYEYDEEVRACVMGLSYSKQPERVEHFLAFVEEHGPAVFEEFGYVK